jgi:hypothetical protein
MTVTIGADTAAVRKLGRAAGLLLMAVLLVTLVGHCRDDHATYASAEPLSSLAPAEMSGPSHATHCAPVPDTEALAAGRVQATGASSPLAGDGSQGDLHRCRPGERSWSGVIGASPAAVRAHGWALLLMLSVSLS